MPFQSDEAEPQSYLAPIPTLQLRNFFLLAYQWLEEALEYIKEDEYVEITPKAMRFRKIILDETERKRAEKRTSDN